VADVNEPGTLAAVFCRSPYAAARLLDVDTRAALAVPGVVGVYLASDLPDPLLRMPDFAAAPKLEPRYVLASEHIRFLGEAFAVVVAESTEAAADAANLVEADLQRKPAVTGVLAASGATAPLVHASVPHNLAARHRRAHGDVEAAFAAAAAVAEVKLELDRVAGGYMEPRGVHASPALGGGVVIRTSTQWVQGVREAVIRTLGLKPDQVAVVAEDVGGGFGPKAMTYPEEVVLAHLALQLQRPVRWIADRSEDTATSAHAHGCIVRLQLAADKDGKLVGLRVTILHDAGAYLTSPAGPAENTLSHLLSAYRIPAFDLNLHIYYTNTVASGFIRGGGREVGNFAIERGMDRLARQLELEPAELRSRNLIQPSELPYSTGYMAPWGEITYEDGDYPALLAAAIVAADVEGVRERQERGEPIGVGLSMCVEACGLGVSEPAIVEVSGDGDVRVIVASTPNGQGHQTSMAQLAADTLGWPMDRITVMAGDTRLIEGGTMTAASRTAQEVGPAVVLAAREARNRLLEAAAAHLEADPSDIELGPGGAHVRGSPTQYLPLELLAPEGPVQAIATHHPKGRRHAASCHVSVVRIDRETGEIRPLKHVIAHDVGLAINPQIVEGQLQGGWAHGVGYSLLEAAHYDSEGTLLTSSFLDYMVPSAPEMDAELLLLPHSSNGVSKGVGEGGTIGVPAAVAAAVDDALWRLGSKDGTSSIPITPERIVQLLASSEDGL